MFDKRPALVAIPPKVDGSSANEYATPDIQVINTVKTATLTIHERSIILFGILLLGFDNIQSSTSQNSRSIFVYIFDYDKYISGTNYSVQFISLKSPLCSWHHFNQHINFCVEFGLPETSLLMLLSILSRERWYKYIFNIINLIIISSYHVTRIFYDNLYCNKFK